MDKAIHDLVTSFAENLSGIIDDAARSRARTAVESAFGISRPGIARRGRPPKVLELTPLGLTPKTRKKAPRQLCPIPGCKNTAAPVFGMVCGDHKNVAKLKIKKYREARKRAKN